LDRTEPLLNTALPGDERDTTTPAAMVGLVGEILVSSRTLSATSQKRLFGWLEHSPTGRSRLRAGLPGGWRAGDKTGTGENGATNDVVIAWPPAGAPLVIAAYSIGSPQSPEQRSETLAEVARIVTTAIG
jgi:beta-lactamase class A